MNAWPPVIGVDADDELVLLASASEPGATIHLAPLPVGRVTRSITIDGTGDAMLTGDRLHVISSTSLVDLRSGDVRHLAAWASPDVLGVSPGGDFAIARDDRADAARGAVVALSTTDGTHRALFVESGRALAAAVAEDASTFFVLSADLPEGGADARLTVEVRRVADGGLERSIPLDRGGVIPDAVSLQGAPLLSSAGDFILVRSGALGYRVLRASDGMLFWQTTDQQAQFAPRAGVVASRASDAGLWVEHDFRSDEQVGLLPVTDPQAALDLFWGAYGPGLAYAPDGESAVIPKDGVLWLSDTHSGRTRLPFESEGWAGRGAFIGPDEFVSIEKVGPDLEVGVRKRHLPGGEIVAEVRTNEPQSEWDGDLSLSPDGRLIAVALPESVRLLRASDLAEAALMPHAAGRIAWAPDGSTYVTTPDVHYRDPSRPPLVADHTVELWTLDAGPIATFTLPFVPTFATFTADGRTIIATGCEGTVASNPAGDAGAASTSLIDWNGPVSSAAIDLASGTVKPLPIKPVAVDPSRRFGTDLFTVERLSDDARVAAFPIVAPVSGDAADPFVAGLACGARSDHPPVFSPDASLVTGTDDAHLILYSSATGARVQDLALARGGFGAIAFSADGRRLAGSRWGAGAEVQLWCASP